MDSNIQCEYCNETYGYNEQAHEIATCTNNLKSNIVDKQTQLANADKVVDKVREYLYLEKKHTEHPTKCDWVAVVSAKNKCVEILIEYDNSKRGAPTETISAGESPATPQESCGCLIINGKHKTVCEKHQLEMMLGIKSAQKQPSDVYPTCGGKGHIQQISCIEPCNLIHLHPRQTVACPDCKRKDK